MTLSRRRDLSADRQQLVDDLRKLPTPALGRLLEPLMPSVLNGDAGPGTLDAVELVGSVLAERKIATPRRGHCGR